MTTPRNLDRRFNHRPRYFAASDGYDPGKSTIPQFAIIVTNQVFESPKIPNIPKQARGFGWVEGGGERGARVRSVLCGAVRRGTPNSVFGTIAV